MWQALRASIETIFIAEWGSRTPIALSNAPPAEADYDAWVRLSIQYGSTERVTLHPPLYRTVGAATVQVFTRLHTGEGAGLGHAEAVANIFRDRTVALPDGGAIRMRAPSVSVVGEAGQWWQINVICPFERDA